MKVKVQDLMSKNVITAQPHQTVAAIKEKMAKHKLNSIPVVSTDKEPVGVVSAADIVVVEKAGLPVSQIMTDKVYTVPGYDDVSVAARIMRNHKLVRPVEACRRSSFRNEKPGHTQNKRQR